MPYYYFKDGNGNYVYAWIESLGYDNNSGLYYANVWINLTNSTTYYLIYNGNYNQYMGINPVLDNLFGLQYGQYDNGANVFNFYDNFAGTNLNTNNWITISTPPSGVITINNGAYFINTMNNVYYVSSKSFTAPYIIDMGGILGINADDGPWFDLQNITSTAYSGYIWITRGSNVVGN
ncbi:MAG: hypothetical protein ACP5NC_08620, partial [Nitrososphaeria archaeon]